MAELDQPDAVPLIHLLEAARAALGEPVAVLDRLLEAWRAVRAPEIASVIDLASKACRLGQHTLVGGLEAHTAEWCRVALEGKPADLDRLMEALVLRDAETSAERVRLLRSVLELPEAQNPRLVSAAAEHLEAVGFYSTRQGRLFWDEVAAALLAVGDPRLREPTMQHHAHRHSFRREAERLPKPRALTPVEVTMLAGITAYLHGREAKNAERDGGALLESVYDSPDDDGPRLVYADWLTERNDVRGEHIMLQFARHAGTITRQGAAREKALFVQHSNIWLGKAAKRIRKDGLRFERGFLAGARASSELGALVEPEWGTCRELDVSKTRWTSDGLLWMLASAPRLRALESLVGVGADFLPLLAKGENSAGQGVKYPVRLANLRAHLRRLVVEGPVTPGLFADLALPALRHLTWFDAGPPRALFEAVTSGALAGSLERLVYRDRLGLHDALLTRDDEGELTSVFLRAPTTTEGRAAAETMAKLCVSCQLSISEDTAAPSWLP